MLSYNIQATKQFLGDCNHVQRVLFAVAYAERLFGVYRIRRDTVRQEMFETRAAIDSIWDAIRLPKTGQHIGYLDNAEQWIRGDDAAWNLLNPIYDNAILATIYACECLESGDVESAKWAADQGYNAADYIAYSLSGLDFQTPGNEAVILRSRCVQMELRNQRDDMYAIEKTASWTDAIDKVKISSITAAKKLTKALKKLAIIQSRESDLK